MKKCAVLTMDQPDNFVIDDNLIDAPLHELGWQVDYISWQTEKCNWNKYDSVIIRSTWDYQNNVEIFLQVLAQIDESDAKLLNSLEIVKWNINKLYLKKLEQNAIDIVPTYWLENFNFNAISDYFTLFNTNQIVIKPTISANSENTFWLKKDSYIQKKELLEKSLEKKQLMIQPFVPAVIEVGEFSVFYFAGQFSHCILKTPKAGDFRVQEGYGSRISKFEPSSELLSASQKAHLALPENVLYARIDLVKYQNSYKVMEVELIEPSLYFSYDKQSPTRFAIALDNWMK